MDAWLAPTVVVGVLALIWGVFTWFDSRRRQQRRERPRLSTDPVKTDPLDNGVIGFRVRVHNVAREPVHDVKAILIDDSGLNCSEPEWGAYVGFLGEGKSEDFSIAPRRDCASGKLRLKYTYRDLRQDTDKNNEHEQVSGAELPKLGQP